MTCVACGIDATAALVVAEPRLRVEYALCRRCYFEPTQAVSATPRAKAKKGRG